jgi:hypothetical protein
MSRSVAGLTPPPAAALLFSATYTGGNLQILEPQKLRAKYLISLHLAAEKLLKSTPILR